MKKNKSGSWVHLAMATRMNRFFELLNQRVADGAVLTLDMVQESWTEYNHYEKCKTLVRAGARLGQP
jgi:glutamate mutase epsilon subunit